MNKLIEAIGQYGVQCSETKELAPPEYLLSALKEHEEHVAQLLAIIEQMRSALGYYTNSSHVVYGKGRARESWEEQDDGLVAREALALTPDLSALKEHSTD